MLSLDVVVRTLADAKRSSLLFRALDSIQDQAGVQARPIVVVNGNRHDPDTLAKLEQRPGIVLHRVTQASMSIARTEGRRLVTADYFAYLDDDDELVAGALQEPLRWLGEHQDCDVLICNGYFVNPDGTSSESIRMVDHVSMGEPGFSLLEDCWLQAGTFVFRSKSIPLHFMDTDWTHMEWTHLAYQICAANKRLHFMDVPMALYYDTPGSMSKHAEQEEAALDLMRSIRSDVRMSRPVRAKADRKYHNIMHILAFRSWRQGRLKLAWRYHLASMRPPYTLKYLLFSRKLLWPTQR